MPFCTPCIIINNSNSNNNNNNNNAKTRFQTRASFRTETVLTWSLLTLSFARLSSSRQERGYVVVSPPADADPRASAFATVNTIAVLNSSVCLLSAPRALELLGANESCLLFGPVRTLRSCRAGAVPPRLRVRHTGDVCVCGFERVGIQWENSRAW